MKPQTKKEETMEHPMTCSQCGNVFDAWGYTLHQRTRRNVQCMVCREVSVLRGVKQVPWLSCGGEE